MAQVSNLTRVLETDKLSWSISSGDRSAATIKATSSTFEAQLKAVRTGTFTVTAKSTVTERDSGNLYGSDRTVPVRWKSFFSGDERSIQTSGISDD